MSYEIIPARELMPNYPEVTRQAYGPIIAEQGWQDLSATDKLGRLAAASGNTPLVELTFDDVPGRMYAKLELVSPTGSHCDRQIHALQRMAHDGLITPGVTTIDETSSGSVLSQLAIHGPLAGFAIHARLPKLPEERLAAIRMPGVELEIVDQGYIPEAARAMTARLSELRKRGWALEKRYTADYRAISATHSDGPQAGHIVFPNHSANPITIASVSGLGEELARQLYEASVEDLTAVVAVIGNGTSIYGIAPAIRRHYPKAMIVGVEDARNHPTYDRFYNIPVSLRRYARHDSYGSSFDGTPLRYYADPIVDAVDIVAPIVRDTTRDTHNSRHPNIAIGNTSAMALEVGRRILAHAPSPKDSNVAVIFYDGAGRYPANPAAM